MDLMITQNFAIFNSPFKVNAPFGSFSELTALAEASSSSGSQEGLLTDLSFPPIAYFCIGKPSRQCQAIFESHSDTAVGPP